MNISMYYYGYEPLFYIYITLMVIVLMVIVYQ